MIPVMMRFWMPHGAGGGPPPGDEYECPVPSMIATFDTNGAIDGTSPEMSPSESWTYSSASATASGGSVSPANFSVGGFGAPLYSAYFAGNRASGETLTVEFSNGYDVVLAISLADGTDGCSVSYTNADVDNTPSVPETRSDTFTLAAGEFAVFIELKFNSELNLYIADDFSTVAAQATSDRFSFPTYLQCTSVEVTCSGSSSTVHYIRLCDYFET